MRFSGKMSNFYSTGLGFFRVGSFFLGPQRLYVLYNETPEVVCHSPSLEKFFGKTGAAVILYFCDFTVQYVPTLIRHLILFLA